MESEAERAGSSGLPPSPEVAAVLSWRPSPWLSGRGAGWLRMQQQLLLLGSGSPAAPSTPPQQMTWPAQLTGILLYGPGRNLS